jgi:predicted PurR-regulated permease PerM
VGIVRGAVPMNPISIFLALAISGGSWGVVSWAVATAVVDVENDLAEEENG